MAAANEAQKDAVIKAALVLDRYIGHYMGALRSIPDGDGKDHMIRAWTAMSDALKPFE